MFRRSHHLPPAHASHEGRSPRFEAMSAALVRLAQIGRLVPSSDLHPEDATLLTACMNRLASEARTARQIAATASGQTSEAAINVGWIVHDIREVASLSEATAVSIEELAASTQALSANSAASAEEAEHARDRMAAGALQMHASRDALTSITGRVARISECVDVLENAVVQIGGMAGVIDAISRQTNLLALNATIEAARAGEAGRGFSVVASEVKALSGQTAGATQQIRERIAVLTQEMEAIRRAVEDSRQAVTHGDERVREAELSFEAVDGTIARNADQIRALATVLDQQRTTTAEIAGNTAGIAGKAAKTRTEIDLITTRLVSSERTVHDALSAHEGGDWDDLILLRLVADAAAWKRQLAAALLGLEPVPPADTLFDRRRLQAVLQTQRTGPQGNAPALGRAIAAEAEAFGQARRLLTALERQDYEAATAAYTACEEHLTALVQHVSAVQSQGADRAHGSHADCVPHTA